NTSRGGVGTTKRQVCFSLASTWQVYGGPPPVRGRRMHRPPQDRPSRAECFSVKLHVERSAEAWAWFAGLFEGQGTVVYHRSARHRVRLQLKSSDADVVKLAQSRIGGNVFGPYQYRYRDGIERKAFWIWVSDGLDPRDVAAEMWPWLGERRRSRLEEFSLEPADHVPNPTPNPGGDEGPA
ncbi:MAG: hypothetical protein ACREQ5_27955, partial [Candidatus Dormibacteria bacterium]